MSPTSYLAAPSRDNMIKEDVGFEPTHAFTRLTVFKTVPFSRTWVILQKRYSPYGIRTRVTAVKRRCLNPLTNGPYPLKISLYSANRARTCDIMINSHALYQLSYGGI